MIIDAPMVSVCPSNFDNRPFRLNDESNLNIYGQPCALKQLRLFEDDLTCARSVSLQQWRERPLRGKLIERLAPLLGSQLQEKTNGSGRSDTYSAWTAVTSCPGKSSLKGYFTSLAARNSGQVNVPGSGWSASVACISAAFSFCKAAMVTASVCAMATIKPGSGSNPSSLSKSLAIFSSLDTSSADLSSALKPTSSSTGAWVCRNSAIKGFHDKLIRTQVWNT